MFHVKPFVQFSLRLPTELAEVLAAVAADASVKPGKMLSRLVEELLGKRRGELLLSARVGPAVGTRKDRAAQAWEELKADTREAFRAATKAAEVDGPMVEETTEEPDFNLQEVGGAPDESRDCPATVGAYRCQLPAHSDGVSHQWGR